MDVRFGAEYLDALREKKPLVALETAVMTHGLPQPHGLEAVLAMEAAVTDTGAVPCTIGILKGAIIIGMSHGQLRELDKDSKQKVGIRDLPSAAILHANGGTTVAATVYLANRYGIRVMATGGIGGVHRGASVSFDISADLTVLGKTPITVVASGAKAILDLKLTLEYLETVCVTVAGYGTDTFPAFYAADSPYKVPLQFHCAQEAAECAAARDELGLTSALLVCNPVPKAAEIPYPELKSIINRIVLQENVSGQDVTPAMLNELYHQSAGRTLLANKELLLSNARLAAMIACEYTRLNRS